LFSVASAIVQRYLNEVLDAALAQNPQTQNIAIDILSFTVKQGLAHPLQSFPIIVALETSPNNALATRANGLHAVLHTKHATILNSRYADCARKTYEYQAKLATADAPLRGYRLATPPVALLQRWYGHVREKRQAKMDFLKALVKAIEPRASLEVKQDDVAFARYMAENFAALEYKLVEEVLHVVKLLTAMLSTLGMQCMHSLQPVGLAGLLDELPATPLPALEPLQDVDMADTIAPPPQQPPQTNGDLSCHTVDLSADAILLASWQSLDKLSLLRSSVVFGIIILLKAHLKALYGITEEYVCLPSLANVG
jgi:cohesin loading factor subunit SCC2